MPDSRTPQTQIFLNCQSLEDLARFFGVSQAFLRAHLYGSEVRRYFPLSIKKKSGGLRTLKVPNGAIKKMQKQLLPALQELGYFSHTCHGFRKLHSIKSGASKHVRPTVLFTVDIADFFPSIHFGRVRGLFLSKPFSFSPKVAMHLANLTCCEGQLAQGAPTSPMIANMIAYGLDRELWTLCRNHGVEYTRYADDLSFSTKRAGLSTEIANPDGTPAKSLAYLIEKHGFRLNPSKTRLKTVANRQAVTGLIVNQRVNVDRRYVDKIRGALSAWERHGYELADQRYKTHFRNGASRQGQSSEKLAKNLKGRISFVGSIRGRHDQLYKKLLGRLFLLDPALLSHTETSAALSLLDIRKLVSNSVFVIDNEGTDAPFSQGTAFYLAGTGYVTCAHCINDLVTLRCPLSDKRYKISNIRVHEAHDIAVFSVKGLSPSKYLFRDSSPIEVDDPVRCIGFPNYSSGATPNIVNSHVAEQRNISAIQYSLLTHGITVGKSGGPAIGIRNQVVGVCQRGGVNGAETGDFRIFPINRIHDLIPHMIEKTIYRDAIETESYEVEPEALHNE